MNKQNKIEFNWELYQTGEYDVVTRDNINVVNLSKYGGSLDFAYLIAGYVERPGECEALQWSWTSRGCSCFSGVENDDDIFLVKKMPEKPEH